MTTPNDSLPPSTAGAIEARLHVRCTGDGEDDVPELCGVAGRMRMLLRANRRCAHDTVATRSQAGLSNPVQVGL